MSTARYRQECYDCYNDEVRQVEEDFEEGRITAQDRSNYLRNLYNNLQSDLSEDGPGPDPEEE